ncbi:MAG: hypothetical protein ABL940_06830 [Bacteroidia bacterium]|jgi:hypothetical protein
METIANLFEGLFTVLKPIGALGNWAFGLAIAAGVAYWSFQETKNDHPEENYDKTQEYLP